MKNYRQLSTKTKLINGAVYFALGAASVGMIVLACWSFTGRDAMTFEPDVVPVKPEQVRVGESVTMNLNFCKHTDAPGRVVRRLVSDRTEILAPTVNEAFESGCYEDLQVPVPIPAQVAPGMYHFNYRITYTTNPLHRGIVEEFNSKPFEVIK